MNQLQKANYLRRLFMTRVPYADIVAAWEKEVNWREHNSVDKWHVSA